MNKFIPFQKFETKDEAEQVAAMLREKGIESLIEQDRGLLDQNIIGKQYDNYVQLNIHGDDFKTAQEILIAATKVDLADVDKDYMLQSFTDNELLDVVAKPDEWGFYNYNVALALLKARGTNVDAQKNEQLQEHRLTELSVPRELNDYWMMFGYGFSVLGILARLFNSSTALVIIYGFYLVPGLLGIILGLYIRLTKRTLPNGTQILSFSEKARKHGLYMLLLGIVSLILLLLGGMLLNTPKF